MNKLQPIRDKNEINIHQIYTYSIFVSQIPARVYLNFILTNIPKTASEHMQYFHYSFPSTRNYTQRRESLLTTGEIKQQLQRPAVSLPSSTAAVIMDVLLLFPPSTFMLSQNTNLKSKAERHHLLKKEEAFLTTVFANLSC